MDTARAAPSELNYAPNQVPLSIASESTRQEFLPSNNGSFQFGNSQVIDISINGVKYEYSGYSGILTIPFGQRMNRIPLAANRRNL